SEPPEPGTARGTMIDERRTRRHLPATAATSCWSYPGEGRVAGLPGEVSGASAHDGVRPMSGVVVVGAEHRCDRGDRAVAADVHDLDAGGVAALGRDVAHRHPGHDAVGGDGE